MGNLEYRACLDSPLLAYCKIPDLPQGAETTKIIDLLLLLDSFEDTFWLHSDSCISHELAFIVNGPTIHSNLYLGIRCCADSHCRTITMPADSFRDLVRVYRRALHPNISVTRAQFHTKANSSRFSRAFDHISRAQRSAFFSEKIAFYCSALEALFSTQQAELAHQIAERVALISSSDPQQRMRKYSFLKDCYSFRSKYVHGSPLGDIGNTRMAETSVQLDELVRSAIEAAFKDEALSAALKEQSALDNYMLEKIFN